MLKRALYWAPTSAKTLAYKALCRPHLEYASAAWDPFLQKNIYSIEMVQNQAVRFILNLKGRDSVSEAAEKLALSSLEARRKNQRFSLLMRILAVGDKHTALSTSYDHLMNQKRVSMQTRAQAKGLPPTLYARNSLYYNSFLPRTIRDLKEKCNNKDSTDSPNEANA